MNMEKTRYILTLLLGLWAGMAVGVDCQSYKLDMRNGLNCVFVRDMVQDRTGYMWFATINGLCRYDGYNMKEVIGPRNIDHELVKDNRTAGVYLWGARFLWVKLRGNLFCCYDLHAGRFVDYTGRKVNGRAFRTGYFDNPSAAWLYDRNNGCRRIAYDGARFSCTDLTHRNAMLPSDNVNFVRTVGDNTWIATTGGLVTYRHGKAKTLLKGVSVIGMACMKGGIYFVGDKGGVYSFANGRVVTMRRQAASFPTVSGCTVLPGWRRILFTTAAETYEYDVPSRSLLPGNAVKTRGCKICTDNRGNDIIYNDLGEVTYIERNSGSCHSFRLFDGSAGSREELRIEAVTTKDRQLWLATTCGYGLFVYDTGRRTLERILPGDSEEDIINTDILHGIYEDATGHIWISQEDRGLSCVKTCAAPSALIPLAKTDKGRMASSTLYNTVRMLHKGSDGALYIANMQKGMFCLSPDMKLSAVGGCKDDVLSVASGSDGTLWTGTRSSGIFIGGRQYIHDDRDKGSLSAGKVSAIQRDSKGRMWIAAFGGGLDMAVKHGDGWRFVHFFNSGGAESEIRTLALDHKGRIWAGTGRGIIVFSPDALLRDRGSYRWLNVNRNVSMDEVHDIMEDSRRRVWACISGSGIALFSNVESVPRLLRHFTTADGLGENMAQSVAEDGRGRICVGTNNGVSVYDERSGRFFNHILSRNPYANICTEGAVSTLADGRLAFGTKAGLLVVPRNLDRGGCPAHGLAVTDVEVNGIPLAQHEGIVTETDATGLRRLTLDHDENSLTIFFSDFSFGSTPAGRYSYIMEGYDKGWSAYSPLDFTMYRNLPPGSYTFRLRSADGDGGREETAVEIVVRPPLWLTWYAFLFYLLLVVAAATIVYRQVKRVNELHNKIKVERQLTEYKLQFFTNVSHEYRTPLTIIQGAMDRISAAGNVPGNLKQPLSAMQKSVSRMMRLVNRLLDFRKVQAGRERLMLEETEIVAFVRDIFYTFHDMAGSKRINYRYIPFASTCSVFIDRHKVDSIVYNLISNAIKYTPAGGDIEVRLAETSDGCIELSVRDSGIGIPKEIQPRLFQCFTQGTAAGDSMGIGLYLSEKFARLHKGSLIFTENPGGGSVFTLLLPAGRDVYAVDDFAEPAAQLVAEPAEEQRAWSVEYRETAPEPMNDCTVMVVEDDRDVREYLVSELQGYFRIVTAVNGEEAWKKIKEKSPDLIVSDVLMPVMTGYKLTKLVKGDDETCDIPVILLTALTDESKRIKGFETGADDYIQKPFSARVLVCRCTQLLQQRQRMKNAVARHKGGSPAAADVVADSRDRKFRKELDNWISTHLADPDMSVDTMAQHFACSRSSLYRRVNQLVGMTPSSYVQHIRMETARRLVAETDLTMAEIASRVGVSDQFYFSRLFKEHFGMPPRKYRNSLNA